jgi:hypothetical protein
MSVAASPHHIDQETLMARRETERDTYGGGRRWAEGAGASWTSVRRGHAAEHGTGNDSDPESARWRGSEQQQAHEGGFLRKLTDGLGITERAPKGYRRSDERIREDICERLWQEPEIDVGDVAVEVREGVVHLEGTVPRRQMKHVIEDIAASSRGVTDVENRIRVNRDSDAAAQSGMY